MDDQKTKLECKIGERVYQFECSPDAPLGELHDALTSMKNHIINTMIEHNKNMEESKELEATT